MSGNTDSVKLWSQGLGYNGSHAQSRVLELQDYHMQYYWMWRFGNNDTWDLDLESNMERWEKKHKQLLILLLPIIVIDIDDIIIIITQ